MSELKSLHKDAIPAALEKAERYRLLNEPGEAESICLDILHVDPENQQAPITLLLALTDRVRKRLRRQRYANQGVAVADEISVRPRVLFRNRGGTPREGETASEHAGLPVSGLRSLREAMTWFEKAESIRPPGYDDPILRWNTCSRIIAKNGLVPREPEEHIELPLE